MKFEVDEQTLKDLNLFSKKDDCIFNYYNHTNTFGGKVLLKEQMKKPSSDFSFISDKIDALRYLRETQPEYEVLQKDVEYVEHYLRLKGKPLKDHFIDAYKDSLKYKIKSTNDYYIIGKGIDSILKLSSYLRGTFMYSKVSSLPRLLGRIKSKIDTLPIQDKATKLLSTKAKKLRPRNINGLDYFLRKQHISALQLFMEGVYELDALFSLVKAQEKNSFILPEWDTTKSGSYLDIEDLYNPLVGNPIKNTISLNGADNCCFLTGPNMSGKSTFLKSVGLCIYLAHLGFPVPAKKMRLSLYKGLITAINLSDNLNLGYSHYYGEVQRIKYVALQIEKLKQVVVIIDEMFRGTNVEEAKYGTTMISSAFTKIKESKFFVSSHIVEVADELKVGSKGVQYHHLGIRDDSDLESYTYQLREGVSNQKLGRKILEQEGVIEILDRVSIKT